MGRIIWAVSNGAYSDYGVTALFEERSDAEAVATRIGGYVEEFSLYSAGDRSLGRALVHHANIRVSLDGSVGDLSTYTLTDFIGANTFDEGPAVSVEGAWLSALQVRGMGKTEEQAVKGAKDRAAKVASMLLDGFDPRDVVRGGGPTEEEIDAAWFRALEENDRREKEEAEALAEARAVELRRLQHTTWVAAFKGEARVSAWTTFSAGLIMLPYGYTSFEKSGLELRKEDGSLAYARTLVSKVAGSGRLALVWPTIDNPNLGRSFSR